MPRRYTYKYYKDAMEDKDINYNNDTLIISDEEILAFEKTTADNFDFKCGKCGKQYTTTWKNWFSAGTRCKCSSKDYISKKTEKSFNEFKKELEYFGYFTEADHNQYKTNTDKILVECPNGHWYKTYKDGFVNSLNRCSICETEKICYYPLKLPELIKNINELYGENKFNYGKLKSGNSRTYITCNDCGGKFIDYLARLYEKKIGCYRCKIISLGDDLTKLNEERKLVWEDEYNIVKKSGNLLVINCHCNHTFEVDIFDLFINLRGCQYCRANKEKSEESKLIKNFDKRKIIYEYQKKIEKFRFDFYFPTHNAAIMIYGKFEIPESEILIKNSFCSGKIPLLNLKIKEINLDNILNWLRKLKNLRSMNKETQEYKDLWEELYQPKI